MSGATQFDERLRSSAFAYLRAVQLSTGGPVRYVEVADFKFEGERVPLMATQQGIRKPHQLIAALSIRTAYTANPERRPYDDIPGPDGLLRYKWRGENPDHYENRAMREAFKHGLPLIWFQGISSGVYLPVFPVWLVAEERALHQFAVAVNLDQKQELQTSVVDLDLRRTYHERIVKERVHQPVFRARVLSAYEGKCAICRLRHAELLDAAHIRSDADGGAPVVTNGISLCKIHHAAYDTNLLGIDTDYRVQMRPDLLVETDGPTLKHTLQELHATKLELPRQRAARPDRDLLAERFEQFEAAK